MKSSKLAVSEFELNFASTTSINPEEKKKTGEDNDALSKDCISDVPVQEGKSTSPVQNCASIKELPVNVTRKICTGQVVISLAGACRELIDNSLDAGATSIEIRVKENGVDSIEVIDNGCGIQQSNFELLCKPHSTSKLSAIGDFNSLSTFGFRGEALNALAALSQLSVITRDAYSKVGTRMTFDKDGRIVKRESCPRQVGTSVIVANLFHSLPVRRQEFQRRSRKEFMKMLTCVQSFALSGECRFNCSNVVNGKLHQMLSSAGNATLKETVSSLFGSKAEKGEVLEIQEALPSDEVSAQYGVQNSGNEAFHKIGISGIVSSSSYGHGRSAPDRQFIYVNKRPVDVPKLNQSIDVNVSPDKRTVFFQHEKELFAKFRASLLATFSKISGSCPRSDVTPATDTNWASEQTRILPQTQMSDDEILEIDDASSASSSLTQTSGIWGSPSASFQFDTHSFRSTAAGCSSSRKRHREVLGGQNDLNFRLTDGNACKHQVCEKVTDDCANYQFAVDGARKPLVVKCAALKTLDDFSFQPIQVKGCGGLRALQTEACLDEKILEEENCFVSNHEDRKNGCMNKPSTLTDFSTSLSTSNDVDVLIMRPQQNLIVNMDSLRLAIKKKKCAKMSVKKVAEALDVQKSKDMTDENQPEEEAEQHLSVMLNKDAFAEMELVGQFNNSFIITRLRNQMFMIDQHASDEKFNFENLQRSSQITTQKLIHPQKLHLGAVQENVLYDNLDVLQDNGFDFAFNDQGPIGNRVCLASVPNLQGCDFNSDDVDEILAFLMEFPGCFYRPTKLRRIFASKACRRSVMFGKALTAQKMEAIVRAMGTMDSPWNCPHGSLFRYKF